MKHGVLYLLMAAIVMAGCRGKAAVDSWVKFTSKEGGFTAWFPEEPKETEMHVSLEGNGWTVYQFSVTHSDGRAFHVLWNDYPPAQVGQGDAESVFDGITKGYDEGGKKVLSEKPITQGGVAGRELAVDVAGKLFHRVRLFMVENRLYQVMTYAPAAEKDDADFGRFLDGFAINGGGGKAGK